MSNYLRNWSRERGGRWEPVRLRIVKMVLERFTVVSQVASNRAG